MTPSTAADARVGLVYDMRAPDFGASPAALYRAAIEQAGWADSRGFGGVTLSEHHGSDDGYLPSPIVLGAAIAGATTRMLLHLNVVLLPLYDPVRLAEDLAVLDLASGGRLRLTVGAGYRPEEYAMFGLDIRRRPSLMERGIEVLKSAWTGEEFEFAGRRLRVTPRPAQHPRPTITLGGASPASARRAARIADGYAPLAPRLYEIYLDELDELGKPHPSVGPTFGGPQFVHVSRDPERAWAQIAPHALHESNAYSQWTESVRGGTYIPVEDAEQLRTGGRYLVLDPGEAVKLAKTHGTLMIKPLMGGLDPDVGWESVELVAEEVIPHLRQPD